MRNIPRGARETKKKMEVKALQINLGRGKQAQDLLMQTANEKDIDILLISEFYRKPTNVSWFQDVTQRAAIAIRNSTFSIINYCETAAGYVWVETEEIRIYSCYYSPNDSEADFIKYIDDLEKSVRTATGNILITGDFNAKAADWGEFRSDKRGDIVTEFIAQNDLVVLNRGNEFTFRRLDTGSIIDLSLSTPKLATRVKQWKVLEDYTLSDHQYIEFHIEKSQRNYRRIHNVQSGKAQPWIPRKLDTSKLTAFLKEIKLIDELKWTRSESNLENKLKTLNEKIVAACETSMPRRNKTQRRAPMYWWTSEIADLRKQCLCARRKATRSKGDPILQMRYKCARKELKIAIKKRQEECWRGLILEVQNDPWGLPYKIVTNKLKIPQNIPGLDDPEWVNKIINDLFPKQDHWIRDTFDNCEVTEDLLFTRLELEHLGKQLKNGKAPGPDGIPNEVLKTVIEVYPEILLDVFNSCLKKGEFPKKWKRQKLSLLKRRQTSQPDVFLQAHLSSRQYGQTP